jgi:hypothetical protein
MVPPTGNQRIFYQYVRDAILFRRPAPVPQRDAIAVMAFLDASFESEAESRTLPLLLIEGGACGMGVIWFVSLR